MVDAICISPTRQAYRIPSGSECPCVIDFVFRLLSYFVHIREQLDQTGIGQDLAETTEHGMLLMDQHSKNTCRTSPARRSILPAPPR